MDMIEKEKIEENQILNMDATELAQAIAKKKTTSVKIVQTYIDHIKKINPRLNALVEERFNDALTEAKQADNDVNNNKSLGPLHGVPISVKESFNVKGMKTTGGLIYLKNNIATSHAYLVEKLIKAGAIIIGKTNTPSLCFCQETDNKLYGRTNNPWDTSRTSGGSSGGEGALLSAGGAAAGIGSDIGGSIRVPSHFNGVIGFKSGKNQLSQDGHFPANSIPLQKRMASFGPMGKSVRDMKLMYEVMHGTTIKPQSLAETSIDILQGEIPYPLLAVTSDLLNQIDHFLSKTQITERTIPPLFNKSAELWQEIMSIDGGANIKNLALPNKKSHIFINYLYEKITKKSDIHPYLSWALIGASIFKPSKKHLKKIETTIKNGDQTLDTYFDNRLLILPVYYSGAQKHGKVYSEIFSIKKTFKQYMPFLAYPNVWGLASLTIPIDVDDYGLPISIQIVGKTGEESRIFKLGERLEKQFRGYVRCATLDSLEN